MENQIKHLKQIELMELLSKGFTNFDYDDKINKVLISPNKPNSSYRSRNPSEIDNEKNDVLILDDEQEDIYSVESHDDGFKLFSIIFVNFLLYCAYFSMTGYLLNKLKI